MKKNQVHLCVCQFVYSCIKGGAFQAHFLYRDILMINLRESL